MKNINYRFVGWLAAVVAVVAGIGGGVFWYYDSGGWFGAGGDGLAIIDVPAGDASSSFAGATSSAGAVGATGAMADFDAGSANSAPTAKNNLGKSESDVVSSVVQSAIDDTDATDDDASDSDANINSASSVPVGDPSQSSLPQVAPAPPAPASAQKCSFADAGVNVAAPSSRKIILNEIAWMGSLAVPGETSAKASEQEWIELKNVSSGTIDLVGWQIADAAGNLKVVIGAAAEIAPDGFYLLVRGGQPVVVNGISIPADDSYAGALPNTGDELELFDANCGVADFLDAASSSIATSWPGGDAATKRTLERDADGVGWHTSAAPGGTPRAENSTPAQFLVSVSFTGNGMGVVSSTPVAGTPGGILCGFTCQASYRDGTKIAIVAAPADGSVFAGWSGACNSKNSDGAIPSATCSFVVSSSVALVADFEQVPVAPATVVTPTATSTVVTSTAATSSDESGVSAHLLIAAIQIVGAASSNDFVKIFNPTGIAADISGWKLHKKSSTGTDYSLKTFATGASIAPGGYYVWANSEDGFADTIGADASSTETLSADNSAALFDAAGDIIDQVAWGTGTNQYVEGVAYPTDPTANQVLARKTGGGAMVDTDDNASDFAIQ